MAVVEQGAVYPLKLAMPNILGNTEARAKIISEPPRGRGQPRAMDQQEWTSSPRSIPSAGSLSASRMSGGATLSSRTIIWRDISILW